MALRDAARTFTHDRSGNFGITFVVLSGVITTAIAFGLETSRLASNERHIQTISDSAAIYGAKLLGDKSLSDTDVSELVKTFVIAQLTGSGIGTFDEIGSKIGVDRANGNVSVQTATVGDLFLPFLSTGPVALTAISEAGATSEKTPVGPGLCGLALNTSQARAMKFKGLGTIASDDCVFWSNSKRGDATYGHGKGHVETPKVCSVGTYSAVLGYQILPPADDHCAPLADPLASWKAPVINWNGCDYGAPGAPLVFDQIGANVTLNPGTYCGGLSVSGARNVTLNPGKYFFGGQVFVGADEQLTAKNVYLHFDNSQRPVQISAALIEMTATKDPALKNIVAYKEPTGFDDATGKTRVQIESFKNFAFEGVFYAPGDAIELTIARIDGLPDPKMSVIANTVMIFVEQAMTLNLQPMIRMDGDKATTKVATRIRLNK